MSADGLYEYDAKRRRQLESAVIPFVIYQFLNGKVYTLLVSDGMCELYGKSREDIVEQFDNDMYRYTHPDDVQRVASLAYAFATEDAEYSVTYREKYGGSDDYRLLHSRGRHFNTQDGTRLAVVWYDSAGEGEATASVTKKKENNPLADVFETSMGAVAIVLKDDLRVAYYNESIIRLLKPEVTFDATRTFSEFFFDGDSNIDEIFDNSDMEPSYFYSEKTKSELEINVISTTWNEQNAYLVNVHDHSEHSKKRRHGVSRMLKRKTPLDNFLNGSENDLPFGESGYKGYMVWNLSVNSMIYSSGLSKAEKKLGRSFSYDEFYQFVCNHVDNTEYREYINELSPENIRLSFFDGKKIPDNIMELNTRKGCIFIKITPTVMQTLEEGELFLKLQAENVTDTVVFDRMMKIATRESVDFAALIDGKSGRVYYTGDFNGSDGMTENKKDKLKSLLTYFSGGLGQTFSTQTEFMSFISEKCGKDGESTFNVRLKNKRTLNIHIKILSKSKKQFFLSSNDVTDLVNMEQNTQFDDLTGLPNMTNFRLVAQQVRSDMRSKGITPAFVYFDLRDMKAINENYGFSKGNGILVGTAYVLRDVFKNEPLSRFAEDHFVVLASRSQLEQRLETVHEKVLNNPSGIPVQICAGIYVDDASQRLDVLAACDRARLACKSLKGDYQHKYRVFDRSMFDGYQRRQHILTHFSEALEKGWIQLYYQPIIRTVTGNICDMEALCRWIDPERGMLSPIQFVPVLEEHRLITKLDFYMVRKICENLKRQKKEKLPLVPVSVNLSRVDFEECNVVQEILKIVDEYKVSHKLLTIEITESAFINNQHFLNDQINKFRAAGFKVWMDDFGSEYSSLNTLQEFNFDLIKLDMKFMKNFSLTGKNHSILSDVVSMVSRLGIHTLAEGVQTKEQLEFLNDIGCEKAQGYLFSRPMPCEYFIERSKNQTDIGYDDYRMSTYYDKVGSVNFNDSILMEVDDSISNIIEGVPAAVIELRDDKYRIMKANEAYKNFLKTIGIGNIKRSSDYVILDRQPSEKFKEVAKRAFASDRWESIVDDNEGDVMVSSRLLSIAYDSHSKIGALLVIVNRTYWKNSDEHSIESEYHFNSNLMWMASRGLSALLGYHSVYEFMSVSNYLHVNLTKNLIEEVHLNDDDMKRLGSDSFGSYDEFVEQEANSQPPSIVTDEQKEFFDRVQLINRFIEGESIVDIEYLRFYDGEYRWKHTTCRMNQVDSQIHAWIFVYDVNDFRNKNEQMKQRAEIDGMTGLLNQTTAADRMGEYLKENPDEPCALVMMDIDNFKYFNDTYGHEFGDSVISRMAEILRETFDSDCLLGRVGGDEFMVLMKNCTEQDISECLSMIAGKKLDVSHRGINEHFTVSAGFAMFPSQGKSFQELYRRADMAMYSVKTNDKANYRQFKKTN